MADVARLAGVSVKTVSRVYSTPHLVSAEMTARVYEAADRLLFKPNRIASLLRRGETAKTLAFITAESMNPFYTQVAAGIERECSAEGYVMFLAGTSSAEHERKMVNAMLSARVHGLLIVPVGDDHSYLEGERRLGTAIVGIDRPMGNLSADSVVLANAEGGYLATKRLIEAGHRRIGYVCNPSDIYTQRERLAGYRRCLREEGLPTDGRWESCGDGPGVSMAELTARLLDAPDPPTAIVGGNNRATLGVVRELHRRQVNLGLVGFDDLEVGEFFGISVISHDPVELGRRAARFALRRLDNPAGMTEQLQLPVCYIARGSGERGPDTEHAGLLAGAGAWR
jgi:LacI family transcriptional regulator